MKNSITKCSIIATLLFWCKFTGAQDLEVWSGANYTGTLLYTLNIGQSQSFLSSNNTLSFNIKSLNTAFKVTYNGTAYNNYPEVSFYSDIDIPWIDGTTQYGTLFLSANLVISCISKSLPQPPAFIPINSSNIHLNAGSYVVPQNTKRMLMLRQAYFWENSEDIGGWHGPY